MKGPPPKTQIRLYWAMLEHPGLRLKDYAQILGISYIAVRHAHSRIQGTKTRAKVPSFCPHCFRASIFEDHDKFICATCGVEINLPPLRRYLGGERSSPETHSFALASVWHNNLGSDANRTIVALRNTMVKVGRIDPETGGSINERPYLEALGHTDWVHFRVQGEDDPMIKKALEILNDKLERLNIPQPVYAIKHQLGLEVRKAIRKMQSPANLSTIIDNILKRHMPVIKRMPEAEVSS